jgi:glycerol dehydrogenase
MNTMIACPGKYIQGPGELANLPAHLKLLVGKAFVIISPGGIDRFGDMLKARFDEAGFDFTFCEFGGECCYDEMERLSEVCESQGCDIIVGIGGGKISDTAKGVAHYTKLPLAVCPTIAATDAPCSSLSVVYTPEGIFEGFLFTSRNPEIVLVDSEVIVRAPARLFVAGIGDALSTYYEARAVHLKNGRTPLKHRATAAAFGLGKLCRDIIFADGLAAKLTVEKGLCTAAVERVIEASTFMSGVGFESGGVAGAHAVYNGFTVYEEANAAYHGEKVAFGILVQLVLEGAPRERVTELVNFCISVGLPVTLAEIGIKEPDIGKLTKVAEVATQKGSSIYNLAVEITPAIVLQAILAADTIGNYHKKRCT